MKPIALNYQHRQAGLSPKIDDGCMTTPAFLTAFQVGKQGVKELTDVLCVFYSCVMVYNIHFVRFEFYQNGNLSTPITIYDMPVGGKEIGEKQILHILEHNPAYIPELFISIASQNG